MVDTKPELGSGEAVKRIIDFLYNGNMSAFGRSNGVTTQAVRAWVAGGGIKPARARELAQKYRGLVELWELRPDIWFPPAGTAVQGGGDEDEDGDSDSPLAA